MKPLETLDRVTTRDGRELVLYRRDGIFTIRIDGWELMSSRAHGSEEELARRAFAVLGRRPEPRVLVGGLGMGFTLRATLDVAPPAARVVVAEVFAAVVRWNRGPLGRLAGRPLDDPRVEVMELDVLLLLEDAPTPFDVVLLDVDNGPEALTLASNRRLYGPRGVERLLRALAPGGVLAVWSAEPDPRFEARLRRAGFTVSIAPVAARPGGKGPRHTVFLARRAEASRPHGPAA